MQLTKDIMGCSGGEIHPRVYTAGSDCPDDLLDAAIEQGAIDPKEAKKALAEAKRLADEPDAEAKRLADEADAEAKRLAEGGAA